MVWGSKFLFYIVRGDNTEMPNPIKKNLETLKNLVDVDH